MSEEAYWTQRYEEGLTGWDIGAVSTPIAEYVDQLEDAKDLRILLPGAGNSYEAQYLHEQGYRHVYVMDISKRPLDALIRRVSDFPREHLLHEDFFQSSGTFDLVLEQTFFCSFLPTRDNRRAYARKMSELIRPGGKLVGLWFDHTLDVDGTRPFGGSRQEYIEYLQPYFEVRTMERCYNSIKPRLGKELFGVLVRK